MPARVSMMTATSPDEDIVCQTGISTMSSQMTSSLRKVSNVYTTQFEVSFAGVFVFEERAASFSFALRQFTIQDVFGNVARFHVLDMAKPAQVSLTKQGKHTVHVGSFTHLHFWHFLFLVDVENALQASHVEAV